MFVGGFFGIVLGVYILYIINKAINRLGEAQERQAQAIITLTQLVQHIDTSVVAEFKNIDKKRYRNAEHINNPSAYVAVINGEGYDPYPTYYGDDDE